MKVKYAGYPGLGTYPKKKKTSVADQFVVVKYIRNVLLDSKTKQITV